MVDVNGAIHHYVGPVRRFVNTPEGEPTNNIFDILPAPLRARVRDAIRRRASGEEPVRRSVAARFPDRDHSVRLDCIKIDEEGDEARFLLTFLDVEESQKHSEMPQADDDNYVRHLENELEILREDLQTTVEELETSNEELKASHEEAMASNEELQSANEELETSREELQSLNEELVTVNHQLEDKIVEVEKATDNLRNLLTSTRLPVLFLDTQLQISSFTASMAGLIELRDSDIGRPFSDLATKIDDPDLGSDAQSVLDDLQPIEREISGADGRVFLRRVQPYRTAEEKIGGVVATFTDITEQATTSRRLGARERQARILADLGQTALATRDLGAFFDEVCSSLRVALDCDYSRVLQFQENEEFFLIAGAGWHSGCVGNATIEKGRQSQAGYTLLEENSVLVQDLDKERRFEGPTLLTDHLVRSGISTVIVVGGKPWGVIGLHDREPGAFDEEDLAILEAVFNIIGSTRSVGVVLSGYLDDGAAGARAIVGKGGQVLVHDPADAMSPDMLRAAISAVGEPTGILDPQALGERLSEMVTEEVGPHRKVDGHVKLEMMIAGLEKASMASEEKLGELSPYNCPDCNGVL